MCRSSESSASGAYRRSSPAPRRAKYPITHRQGIQTAAYGIAARYNPAWPLLDFLNVRSMDVALGRDITLPKGQTPVSWPGRKWADCAIGLEGSNVPPLYQIWYKAWQINRLTRRRAARTSERKRESYFFALLGSSAGLT